LKDLDDVFGSLLDTKAVNILVVRQLSDSSERAETNDQITALRDEMVLNHERLRDEIHEVANKVTEMRSSLQDQIEDQHIKT
jgi:HAMP domain-containing protein